MQRSHVECQVYGQAHDQGEALQAYRETLRSFNTENESIQKPRQIYNTVYIN